MWFTILFGLSLFLLAVLMLFRNRAAWQAEQPSEDTNEFQLRQYRRRRQATILIAAVGLAISLSVWIRDTKTAAMYWLGVLLIAGWMAVLAIVDLLATRAHFGRMLQDHRDERTVLEAELEQLRRHQGNGKPTRQSPEDQK